MLRVGITLREDRASKVRCLGCAGWQWNIVLLPFEGNTAGRRNVCVQDGVRFAMTSFAFGMLCLEVREPRTTSTYCTRALFSMESELKNGRLYRAHVHPSTQIGELELDWTYYLADGLYPRYKIFVQTIG